MKTSLPLLLVALALVSTAARSFAELSATQNANVEASLDTQLRGLGFSAGIAAIRMNGATPIDTAVVDSGGIVRVTEKSRTRVGGIMEAHYLFGDARFGESKTLARVKRTLASGTTQATVRNDFAAGLTVMAELGDNVIRSVGLGPIFSLRRFDVDTNGVLTPRGAAFNLGVVALVEPKVKQLAQGIEAGKTLPSGETLRFRDKESYGVAILMSAGF